MSWIRIPASVPTEEDRRTLCAILCSLGLAVRVVKEQDRGKRTVRRYIEYRLPNAEEP